MLFAERKSEIACLLWIILSVSFDRCSTDSADDYDDEDRPYEFSFNIVDFQHRFEKKDKDGIITGEYGFITADGVYHETGYATDKNGDFIITKMRNRKITSLKDARDIFKDQPEVAEKLVEAVAKACSGCKIPVKQDKDSKHGNPTEKSIETSSETPRQSVIVPIIEKMMRVLTDKANVDTSAGEENSLSQPKTVPGPNDASRDLEKGSEEKMIKEMVASAKKFVDDSRSRGKSEDRVLEKTPDEGVLEKMANDLYYRFNYTISTHGHNENGYRDGTKDGSYRSQSENGVDTMVEYLSNEFGHQPNITFSNSTGEDEEALKGYSFLWFWH